jgi:site-specific DNA recombinase
VTDKKFAVAFVRSADTDQNQQNASIAAQCAAIAEYGKKYDMEIQHVFKSATKDASAEFWNMLSYCVANPSVKYVLVQDASRLTRSFADYSSYKTIFAKHNVVIRTATQGDFEAASPLEHFMEMLVASMSEFSGYRSEMVKRGMAHRAEQGYAVHQPPFGYKTTKTPGLFEPDLQGNFLGSQLKDLAAGYTTIDAVATAMAHADPFEANPKPWSVSKVKRIASNPYYAGFINFQGILHKGKHTSILTPAEQQQLIEQFAK